MNIDEMVKKLNKKISHFTDFKFVKSDFGSIALLVKGVNENGLAIPLVRVYSYKQALRSFIDIQNFLNKIKLNKI